VTKFSEATAVDLVARLGPWAGPVPTAYLVFRATHGPPLSWPWAISAIAAAFIEVMGLSAINTALIFREHNKALPEDKADAKEEDKGRNKADAKEEAKRRRKQRMAKQYRAPFALALTLAVGYLAVIVALTVLLDTWPRLAQGAPLLFPLLSGAAYAIIAMRADHRRRVDEMIVSRIPPYNKKAHAERRNELLGLAADAPQTTQKPPKPAAEERRRKATIDDFRRICPAMGAGGAKLSADDVAAAVDADGLAPRSHRTMQDWATRANRGEL
jgi:hypothetical protein